MKFNTKKEFEYCIEKGHYIELNLVCEEKIDTLPKNNNNVIIRFTCTNNILRDVSNIFSFKHLKFLDLSHNIITFIDLSNLVLLEELNLSHNQLNTLILGDIDKLITLNASHNKLTDIDLNKLSNIKILDLSYNNITALPIVKNETLKEINMEYNGLKYFKLYETLYPDVLILNGNKEFEFFNILFVKVKQLFIQNMGLKEIPYIIPNMREEVLLINAKDNDIQKIPEWIEKCIIIK